MRKHLFISLIVLAAGCHGNGLPSGTDSPAANRVPIATGKRTGGGGSSGGATSGGSTGASSGAGGAASVRLIAWSEAQVLPGMNQDVWLFFTDPGLDPGTIDLLVNGKGIGNAAFQALSPSPIGSGPGQWAILTPMPPAGATLELTGQDSTGQAFSSNVVTVDPAPFATKNLPPFFVTTDPQDGATQKGQTPYLSFNAAAAVATYDIVVLELTYDPTTQTNTISDVPVCVEVAPQGTGAQTWQVGAAAPVVYSNAALANPGHFAWHVVALDQSGWGIGTSVDVAGFNAVGASNQPTKQVADTWPEFDSN